MFEMADARTTCELGHPTSSTVSTSSSETNQHCKKTTSHATSGRLSAYISAMDQVLTESINTCATQHFYDDSSDCTTITSSSRCSPSSTTWTTDALQNNSTASLGSESEGYEYDDSIRSTKRNRRAPPPIFFGTPCKKEHEKRAKYETKMRTRRLLRRDSLELARRKSVGSERRTSLLEIAYNQEREAEKEKEGERLEDSSIPSAQDLPLAQETSTVLLISPSTSPAKGTHADATLYSDNGSETIASEEDHSFIAGEKTILLSKSLIETSDDAASSSSSNEQAPTTPIRQTAHPRLIRPSLALSDADSSPGIPLAPHSSSTSGPSLIQVSPVDYSDVALVRSPYATDTVTFSPIALSGGIKRDSSFTGKGRRVLQDSPSKANQVPSPSKSGHSASPNKAVVRQTLSAWAHSKLKTPQSPEKREWDMMRVEATSPIRPSQSVSMSDGERAQARKALFTGRAHLTDLVEHSKRPTGPEVSNSSPIKVLPQGPPSRIARPVAVSRLPRPAVRPAMIRPSDTAKRIPLDANTKPIRNFASSTLSSASRSLGSRAPTYQPNASRQAPSASRSQQPFKMPLRASVTANRSVNRSTAVRAPLTSSSPERKEKSRPIQRSMTLSSSPIKRQAVVKAVNAPIVRDARLMAVPQRATSPVKKVEPAPSPYAMHSKHVTEPAAKLKTGGKEDVSSKEVDRENKAIFASMKEDDDWARRKVKDDAQLIRQEVESVAARDETCSSPSVRPEPSEQQQQIATPREQGRHLGREPRQSRRGQEKQVIVQVRKPTPSSSLFPSSTSLPGEVGPVLPISKAELSRLTSLHTRHNETFVSQLETIIVRKRGENRPASPSSKIRRTNVGIGQGSKEAAKDARERRARKRTPEAAEEGEERGDNGWQRPFEEHCMGAGEDQVYHSPLHTPAQGRVVRWHKALFRGPSDNQALPIDHHSTERPSSLQSLAKKSSLSKSSKKVQLDRLGNVLNGTQALSPRLAKNKVKVYKVIYDDDEE